MNRHISRIVQLAAFAMTVIVIGCAGAPTGPDAARKTRLSLDGDPTPCDSTVVTDGTCRGGYIIPW